MLAGQEGGERLGWRVAGEAGADLIGEAGDHDALVLFQPGHRERATSAAGNHMIFGSEFSDSSGVNPADSANSVFTGPGHSDGDGDTRAAQLGAQRPAVGQHERLATPRTRPDRGAAGRRRWRRR